MLFISSQGNMKGFFLILLTISAISLAEEEEKVSHFAFLKIKLSFTLYHKTQINTN